MCKIKTHVNSDSNCSKIVFLYLFQLVQLFAPSLNREINYRLRLCMRI